MTLIRWAGSILLAFTFGSGILAYASAPAACGTSLTAGFTVVNVRNQPGGSNYSANPPQATLKMGIWYPSLRGPAQLICRGEFFV